MRLLQPKLLGLLSCVQMCKFFSHYGLRALLILYMVNQLQFSDSHSFGVNAVFIGLIELGGIFGGILADRFLGLRRSLFLGASILALGYFGLMVPNALFLALGLIILGGTLFGSNITALLGSAYSENDPRRERGFTLFYMIQNVGALISTLLCPLIATQFGFQWGFLIAALGMVVGVVALIWKRDLLPQERLPIQKKNALAVLPMMALILGMGILAIFKEEMALPFLPWITGGFFCFFAWKLLKEHTLSKSQVRQFLIYLGALILFFAAEEQICSSLVLFSERETNRALLGWEVPSSVIMAVNPVVIILFGTLISKFRAAIFTPFALVALSFGSVALLCLFHLAISFWGVIGMVAVVSLAELMVGPIVMSFASEVAAKGRSGMVMGMVPIAFSLAFLLGGGFSKMVAIEDQVTSLATYGAGFGKIALLTLIGGLVLQLLLRRMTREKYSIS